MREFLTAVWRKKQRKAGQRSKDQIRKPAQDLPLPAGPPHEQSQSLLFSQLPTELRLAVYREALVSDLLLHILHELPDNGELDRLGHWRCDDPENPHMIWQHKCFGLDKVNTNWLYRMTPRTNGNLLGILLACRSSYLEAKQVLYTENHFSFKGARGVSRLQSVTAPRDWQLLRHVHVSTHFRTPMQHFQDCSLPPENYNHWRAACDALRTLTDLHTLKIDMTVWNYTRGNDSKPPHHESVMSIFEPLVKIKARSFVLELNIELPPSVRHALGELPFEIVNLERPYNWDIFWRLTAD